MACLLENKGYYPSDSKSRIGWHSFLIKFSKKLKLLSPLQKRHYIRTLPLQTNNAALIEDGMAAADDVGADNNNDNSIDNIVLPAQRRVP